MIVEIKIPSPGESISEVVIANWLVKNGDVVEKNQELAEIESEKATLSLTANETGKIAILLGTGTVKVGATACTLDTSFTTVTKEKPAEKVEKQEVKKEVVVETKKEEATSKDFPNVKVSPVAKNLMEELNLSVDEIIKGLKRIGKNEVLAVANLPKEEAVKTEQVAPKTKIAFTREVEAQKMSQLRKKLAERLVSVKNETAMLTTFNEVDMSQLMELRAKYNPKFQEKYGTKVGLISPFAKAASIALSMFPEINAMIQDEEIVYHKYSDIGVAVQSPKGLIVPVIRNVESLSIAQIELKIKEYATKAQANKISLDELTNGTFTITNGGTFGSLFSTPIINPPQSGILGMHNIVDRPMAVKGQVVIRPMMYIALSYDHRIIDGKSAVGFLVKIKELIENPINMLFDTDPYKVLFEI